MASPMYGCPALVQKGDGVSTVRTIGANKWEVVTFIGYATGKAGKVPGTHTWLVRTDAGTFAFRNTDTIALYRRA